MKAQPYIRVSTDKQVTGSSMENQLERIKSYCQTYNLDMLEPIIDKGLSGRTTNREGFKQVMDKVVNKECEAVIVYSLSRFARNTRDTIDSIEVMKKNGIAFISVCENIDTNSSMGEFFYTLMSAIAQLESKQTGERVKSVKETNKRNLKTYSAPIYGFDNFTKGNLVVNEKEMETVMYIREIAKKLSYRKIAKELNDRLERTKKGKKWYASTICNIVANTVYENVGNYILINPK